MHSANRTHRASHAGFHTRAHVQNPSSPNPPTQPDLCPSAGSATSPRAFPDRVSYPRNRARGGLVRGTVRTTRARPCRPGTVPFTTTAATRHLARHSRSLCLHSALAHLRATRPRLHSIPFTFPFIPTTGDAAACSCMATDISRVYSDLTHGVTTRGVVQC